MKLKLPASATPTQRFLCFAAGQDVLRFGDFTTKAGRKMPYFFNAGLFNTGRSLVELGRAYAAVLVKSELPDVIFGPAYKAINLAAAATQELWLDYGIDVKWAFNRKEAKEHGEGGKIVGASLEGMRVGILDDVITAGTAKKEAVEIITAEGGTPFNCTIAFDRQERGTTSDLSATQEFQNLYGIPLVAAATLDDLIGLLEADPEQAEHLAAILAYREKYGVKTEVEHIPGADSSPCSCGAFH